MPTSAAPSWTHGAFNEAYTIAIVCSGLFCAAFLYFLHRFDRWERTPASLAIFVLLMGLAPVVIRTVSDGLIVGAYVGLGFQILEDVLYAQNSAFSQFGAHQSDAVLGNFVLRAITGIPSHALYTALFAAGLIYLIGTPAQPRRALPGVVLVLAPVLIHGVWDSAAALGGETFAAVVLLADTIFSIVAILVVIRWAGRRERQFMHDIIAPEVTAGTITQAELDALVGLRG